MKSTIKAYVLSPEAEADLGEIFDYTEQQFGIEQAEKYLLTLEMTFKELVVNPRLGREREEIRKGLRSFVPNSHVVFYRIREDHVRIVRVLHGSRDLPDFL